MIALNIKMPEYCYACPFRNEHSGTCAFSGAKAVPDIGKPEWCPLLEVKIAKRRAVFSDADLKLVDKVKIADMFSEDSATSIGKLMLENGAIIITEEVLDEDNGSIPFKNHVLTATAFIVIPEAVMAGGKVLKNAAKKT